MGGSANSAVWTQIKADVTGCRIEVPGSDTATTLGAAILAGSKNESSVAFNKLKSIRTLRRYQTIKVNERMEHCQVYAKQEDFDFVLNYILEHAPKGIKVK